jgi:uncharacterized membrane protein YfcA
MSLVVVGLTSAVGALTHWRSGTLELRTVAAFGPPAIVGAVLGAELGLRVSGAVQLTVFAVLMLAAAVSMYAGQEAFLAPRTVELKAPRRRPGILTVLLGATVGLLTGFVGVGGGFLYVPTLVLVAGLPMRKAVGTSLALIMVSCIAGVLRYQGTLAPEQWSAVGIFSLIAFVGVAVGTRLVRQISQQALRRGFALLLLVMGTLVLLVGR